MNNTSQEEAAVPKGRCPRCSGSAGVRSRKLHSFAMASTCSAPPAPASLQVLTTLFLLRHAPHYDEGSRVMIAENLIAELPDRVLWVTIATPGAFAGCAVLPSLLDMIRQSLAPRVKLARRIFTSLIDAPLQAAECEGIVAACDGLLTTGVFKRDVIGPSFARPEADMLRRLRKVAQREAEAAGGTNRWREAVWNARLSDESHRTATSGVHGWQHRYQLKRLEAHTG